MKIPNIIHFTVPAEMSVSQQEMIERARSLHPGWEIKIWSDPLKNDDYLLEKYWRKGRSGAALADLVRLDVLFKYGGVYVDSDIKLLRSLDALVEHYGFFIASEDGNHLTNALFGAQKGSSVLHRMIDYLNKNEPDWDLPPNITTGSNLFSNQLKWCDEVSVLPRQTFYCHMNKLERNKAVHRHSYGEHLWDHSSAPPEPDPERQPLRQTLSWSNLKTAAKAKVRNIIIGGLHTLNRLQALDPAPKAKTRPPAYPSCDELVVETIHGFKIVVDGRDLSLTPELVFGGFYEFSEEAFAKHALRGGDWAIDIGANVGSFSLLAAKCVGPFGRVFAYEPNPRPAGLMSKSLVMNWMHERVIQRQAAVGDTTGTVELKFVPERLGDSQISQPGMAQSTFFESLQTLGHERAQLLAVPSVRLDEEFPVDLPIRMLKIDAEGYEARVLAGADRLLQRRCIDFVMIELLEEVAGEMWGDTLTQVKKVIGYGYSVCTAQDEGQLTDHEDLASALRAGHRNIVLVARDQYRTG